MRSGREKACGAVEQEKGQERKKRKRGGGLDTPGAHISRHWRAETLWRRMVAAFAILVSCRRNLPNTQWAECPMPSEVPTVTGDQSLEALRRELAEAREQQAATAEILASISTSVTDANQVFSKIAASAARLCDAFDAAIFQVDGSSLRLVAHHGQIPFPGPIGQHKIPLVRGLLNGRAVIERRTNHVADMQAEAEEYPEGRELAVRLGWRTGLSVPLLRAGGAIGAILLRRREVRPFTHKQIELLKTFADQAVIAIENTRLFEEVQARTKELQESLEYQTATSDVLGVISRSPTQLQPVVDAI